MATERLARNERQRSWDDSQDEEDGQAFNVLTAQEASALRERQPPLSPWWVVAVQAAVGVVTALLAALLTHRQEVGWSALYGAATVVVPGALMARGMTSRLSNMSLGAGAVSFVLWETVKIAVSVAMLMLAPQIVQPLSWPALLAALVLCMQVYWLALLWRRRGLNSDTSTRK